MLTIGRVWSKAARARRAARQRKRPPEDWQQIRIDWIREHAPGRSFADIGGMFKLVGDMAFLELTGRAPGPKESKLFNAMVVTLVERRLLVWRPVAAR